MDVEDAELLALAGGDSSDEEDTKPTITKAVSPLPSIEISQPTFSGSNSTPRPSTKRGGSTKTMKKTRKDDSEEDGEASSTPGSPNSLQSAPMSESDSDTSPVDEQGAGGPLFPVDNKFYSEKDKKEVMALSEIQREAILAERAALLERQTQGQHLRRLLEARQRQEVKGGVKKRKAADLEDSPRKSSRQKTTLGGRKVGETSGAIEEYKRQREEKGIRDKQRRLDATNRKNRRTRSSSDNKYSSADADGESEVEWDDGKPKVDEHQIRKEPKADYTDVRRATLPRNVFADYCFYPGFAEAVKDCFVRIPNPDHESKNGQMTYRMVLVKDIVEKEGFDYAMEKKNGKRFVTNQHAMLIIDGSAKELHLNGVSNSNVTEAEVANYGNMMEDAGKPLPTKPFLHQKILDVESVINHSFTEAELQEKLRRSGVLQQGSAGLERETINHRRRAAEEREDEAAIAKCDAELAALNGPKLMYGTTLVAPQTQVAAPTQPSEQDRLAELNKKNRKANREDVRKAQLAERKAERLSREAVQRGEALQNPFARVKTYAKTHHDVNQTLTAHRAGQQVSSRDISRSGTPANTTTPPKPEETKLAFPSPPQLFTASGMPMLGSRNMDDEIIASLDMGIDIEL